jgi:hypothetical protein
MKKLEKQLKDEWLSMKFKKLAEEKGWTGKKLESAEIAFFAGASSTALMAGKKRLGEKYDRRRKLTDKQKDRIMLERTYGEKISVLAKKYDVSKSLIYLICNPESYKKNKERSAEWNRINKPNGKDAAKRTYIYKRDLVIKGLI